MEFPRSFGCHSLLFILLINDLFIKMENENRAYKKTHVGRILILFQVNFLDILFEFPTTVSADLFEEEAQLEVRKV